MIFFSPCILPVTGSAATSSVGVCVFLKVHGVRGEYIKTCQESIIN